MQLPGYRIIRKISQGGMSTVYLAVQLSVGREVALKVMSPVLNADPVFSERFQREANIVGQLPHPNIVSIYDIGVHKNLNYIAMDYLPGGTVHDKLREGISFKEVLRITKDVARALDLAHSKGYVHRDIKPDNILFREDGTTVLTDFGVAKAVSTAARVTNAGTVVGTPHYMSPEQSRGNAIDGRSDLYSLGIVFYEMLTGSVPFHAEEAVAIAIKHLTAPIPTVPPQYAVAQKLLNNLLAKDPDKRFQTGQQIVDAIEGLEETLAGYSSRRTPLTDPTNMNVMTLLKALLITTWATIKANAGDMGAKMLSWRWTPRRGLYRRPTVRVTEIRTQVDTFEEQRATIVSTRVQKAAYYQQLLDRRFNIITRSLALVFLFSSIWGALAVGSQRFNVPTEKFLPAPINDAIISTAGVMSQYGAYLFGGDSRSRDVIAKAEAETSHLQHASMMDAKPSMPRNAIDAERHTRDDAEQSAAASTNIDKATLETRAETITDIPQAEAIDPVFALHVRTQPTGARIRVLNIRERFHQGMKLEPGAYHIEVSKAGFRTLKRWERLENADLNLTYTLREQYKAGESVIEDLDNGDKAPEMIVLPKGRFLMGKKDFSHTAPEREVEIKHLIAIGKYEITFADYNRFVAATGAEKPKDERWGEGSRPVINVSWDDAVAYAKWLSKQTGKTFRLPTEAEWEYAARAGTETENWWGDGEARGKANCKRGCDSDYAGMFSVKSAPVGSYLANPFSLHDTAGNVAEWVQDCYQDHYLGAADDGSPVQVRECKERAVRGGSMRDGFRALHSFQRRGVDADSRSEMIGFRLVLELD